MMSLDDPSSVIYDILSFQTHALKAGSSVQHHGCAGRNTGHLLQKTSEETISASGESVESNFSLGLLAVQKLEVAVPNPL